MSDEIDAAHAEAVAYASVDRVPLYTAELHHSAFPEPARIVRSHGDILSAEPLIFGHRLKLEATAPVDAGETVIFLAVQFELTLPGQEENRLPELAFSIDAVSGELVKLLRLAARSESNEYIGVIYRKYFADDPDTVIHKVGGLFLTEPKSGFFRTEGRASPPDATKIPYSTKRYNAHDNPSLAQ